MLTKFEITDREKNSTKGSNYVYELYTMSGADKKKIQYDMTFDRTILKYGVTNHPNNRYAKCKGYLSVELKNSGSAKKKFEIRMNVLNSDISRGEAFYLESFYAMKYAKKYGSFPVHMFDRHGWDSEPIDIEWRDNDKDTS